MKDPYQGREQTKAKHFILRQYLYSLAFKILTWKDVLTFVDGFSGPWESRTEDFSDTSFMIAIDVLKDVQQKFRELGNFKTIKCFFVEKKPKAFADLKLAVAAHHDSKNNFYIETYGGLFEDAVPNILNMVEQSFALVFIDPKGWTGYPYDKIGPLLRHEPGEVLINWMHGHAHRFVSAGDPKIEASFAPVLGGPNWKSRLDPTLAEGEAVVKLFREELQKAGAFQFVTTTRIDKATEDRPHYFLAYGTRSSKGLKTFRNVEVQALRSHEGARQAAKIDRKVRRSGQSFLFPPDELPDESTIDSIIEKNKRLAKAELIAALRKESRAIPFSIVCAAILRDFMLRETDAKDICKELADENVIEPTWKADGKRKPHDHHQIRLNSA